MPSVPVINLRKGHAVRYNNDVCVVSEFELKTPPRMASYVQMSIRSITIGKVYNLRMTSNESLESVVLNKDAHEYTYKDGAQSIHRVSPAARDSRGRACRSGRARRRSVRGKHRFYARCRTQRIPRR